MHFKLIVAFVEDSKTDDIMEAAREAGATGCTVINNARGEAITTTGVYTGGSTVAFQSTEFVIQQGGSATTTATSEGGAFFPFGEGGGGTGSTVKSINLSSIRIGL